jgi:excisionase family DNA binding protein
MAAIGSSPSARRPITPTRRERLTSGFCARSALGERWVVHSGFDVAEPRALSTRCGLIHMTKEGSTLPASQKLGDEIMPSILIEKEVAEIFRVPQSTIRAWRIQGKLPAIRLPGRGYRFKREVIEAFLSGTAAVMAR